MRSRRNQKLNKSLNKSTSIHNKSNINSNSNSNAILNEVITNTNLIPKLKYIIKRSNATKLLSLKSLDETSNNNNINNNNNDINEKVCNYSSIAKNCFQNVRNLYLFKVCKV